MEGKLSADLLKVHNANLRGGGLQTTKNQTGSTTMSSLGAKGSSLREKLAVDKSDKRSDGSSRISGMQTSERFSRLRTKMRLHTLFGGAISRSKAGSEISKGPTKVLENTYRTEPDSETKFVAQRAEQIIRNVLNMYLKERTYDGQKFPQLCKTLADLIKERVKMTGMRRFKVLAHVMILESKEQSVTYGSRCLWDTKFDNYATATYKGPDFVAIGSVFAVYYD
ncbi:hypothetical protein FSP39_009401 [Pinctada imbricata]|uniref:Uncharacterized protein n=1 Tax=Pinctada imbricata TaxID=66713 RepID=A0AA88XW51_PINIB|nr:hypothetical protein FSP39_009401 [Pinctada imbricata]